MSIKLNRETRDIEKIIERMCDSVGASTLLMLAKHLGIKSNTISSWITNGTVPYAYIDALSKESNKPFEWFLDGSTQCSTCVAEQPDDPYISSVSEMMRAMDDDTKKDIQLSVQKEKLLRELIKERQDKEAA